jgi:hypothetical protein
VLVLGRPVGASCHPARVVNAESDTGRSAQRAEVGDAIAWRLCYCDRREQAARRNQSHNRFHLFVPPFKEALSAPIQVGAGCAGKLSRKVGKL